MPRLARAGAVKPHVRAEHAVLRPAHEQLVAGGRAGEVGDAVKAPDIVAPEGEARETEVQPAAERAGQAIEAAGRVGKGGEMDGGPEALFAALGGLGMLLFYGVVMLVSLGAMIYLPAALVRAAMRDSFAEGFAWREVFGFIKGYSSLKNESVPHVHLNPLYSEIPELDPTRGGTVIGASRAYVDPEDIETVDKIWMDGELVDWDDATVHVLTHTLHYGCGVFDGIRAVS